MVIISFNTQPPEGGWRGDWSPWTHAAVSTHSRPKAAGPISHRAPNGIVVSTHSRPKAAGNNRYTLPSDLVFQHTAARRRLGCYMLALPDHACFNTQPPEGGWFVDQWNKDKQNVSTHSRPKAAGASLKSLAPSGFAALISLSSQEKREREYNTAFSVTPTFAIS